MSQPQVIEYLLKSSTTTVENASLHGIDINYHKDDFVSHPKQISLFNEKMQQLSFTSSTSDFKGFYVSIPMSHVSEDGASTVFTKHNDEEEQRQFFEPLGDDTTPPQAGSIGPRTRNALAVQAILEWYNSWQNWQRKLLLAGIVKRISRHQLKTLSIAMEPIFHQDFSSMFKKSKLASRNANAELQFSIDEKPKQTSQGRAKDKNTRSSSRQVPGKESSVKVLFQAKLSNQSMQDDKQISESGRGNSDDTPIKSDQSQSSKSDEDSNNQNGNNDRTPVASDVEPLQSYQANTEQPRRDNDGRNSRTNSEDNQSSDKSDGSSRGKMIRVLHTVPVNLEKKIQSSAKPGMRKKKKKKKFIPPEVISRISSASSTPLSPSVETIPSYTLPSSQKYPDRIESASPSIERYFPNNTSLLGRLMTTESKSGMRGYDAKRNKIPVPLATQTCKYEKTWGTDAKTINIQTHQLKEQFSKQLDQIWEWLSIWPTHQHTRVLQVLMNNSDDKILRFIANCVRDKSQESDESAVAIDMLSDKLLLRIFDHLTPIDTFLCSLVCKRWYSALQSDKFWQHKCKSVGITYGIPELPSLLRENIGHNETLDWQKACVDIYEYLLENVDPLADAESGSEEEEDLEESMSYDQSFKEYVPHWKVHPNLYRKKSKRPDTPELITTTNTTTEDIKDIELENESGRSDICLDVDMFADMQPWSDVEVMTQIGQNFAVDFHLSTNDKKSSSTWLVDHDVMPVTKVQILRGHRAPVYCVRCQGKRILSAGLDRRIRVWNLQGECFKKFENALKGGCNSIYVPNSENARKILTASWDMNINVWDSITFNVVKTIVGHTGSVTQVLADDMYIVSCSHDGTIRVWRHEDYKCVNVIQCHTGAVQCISYHKRIIVSGGVDKRLCVSNAVDGDLIKTYSGHNSPITAVKIQHNLLVSGDMEGYIIFWSFTNLLDGGLEEKLHAHESQINTIILKGPRFFTASNDALVKEWEIVTMSCLRVLQGHTDAVMDIQVTDKFIVTASRDNDVRLWWLGSKYEEENKKINKKQNNGKKSEIKEKEDNLEKQKNN